MDGRGSKPFVTAFFRGHLPTKVVTKVQRKHIQSISSTNIILQFIFDIAIFLVVILVGRHIIRSYTDHQKTILS